MLFAQNASIFEAEEISWQLLLDAEQAFYNREYGTALKLANTALVNRQKEVDWSLRVLDVATKSAAFHSKDALDEIYKMLLERDEHDAILLLESVFIKYGLEDFDNSLSQLRVFIQDQKEYPEVYFLIAKIYMLEGEWKLAEDFFLKSYKYASHLIVQSQKYDILYALFDLYTITKEIEKQEKTLLLIIADDPHYSQNYKSTSLFYTAAQAIRTNIELNKFFLLYHSQSLFSMRAYYELAKMYSVDAENKGLVLQLLSLAAISAYDRIETIIKNRVFDYSFESFDTLLRIALKYDDILDWMQSENVWEIFYNLALSANENKNASFAKTLLIHISNYCPDNYWKKRALEAYIQF